MSSPLFIGAISGTSVDGLDLALLEAGTPPSIAAGRTVAIPSDLTRLLKDLGSGKVESLDSLGEADYRLGVLIGSSIVELLADAPHPVGEIATRLGIRQPHESAADHPDADGHLRLSLEQ